MAKHPLLTDTPGNNARSEALRVLRTNLQFLDLDQEAKSFVVTSAVPGEGKTSTSTNLAIALAQAGKKVLLVDGDLRRPRLASLLNLESAVGLTTVLVGRSDLRSTIQVHAASGVNVLTSGPIPPNPSEVLQSRATKDLMKLLRESFDTVIIDAPPLLPVADAAIMATQVDGAILVVRHGKTTKDQVKLAANRVGQVGARLFGVVVNMTPRRGGSEFGYDYGYGYGYYESASAAAGSHRYAGADR
jgi:receptor protein-tyrosine kinase